MEAADRPRCLHRKTGHLGFQRASWLGIGSPKVIAPITSASVSMAPEKPTAPEGRDSSIEGLSHH